MFILPSQCQAQWTHKTEERDKLQAESDSIKKRMAQLREDLQGLELAALKAEDMKIFIQESLAMEKERVLRPDVYTIMEQKIEQQRDRSCIDLFNFLIPSLYIVCSRTACTPLSWLD